MTVKKIKINTLDGMGIVLYALMQQNILKEFLIEKTYFDRTNEFKTTEPVDINVSTQSSRTTFNWANASNHNRTNIVNWVKLLSTSNLQGFKDRYPKVEEIVQRRNLKQKGE